ncbi:MAG: gliding motility-associated peptidyl-prolyl isomerase GldI [Flavobacteriaceae bacterium]|nr:gliding motility-associated peptidyl-prolyl isomerase GldI [Flavobacteriaceae bacterium]
MKYSFVTFILFLLISCSNPEARRPISHHTDSYLKKSIQRNKQINAFEEEAIKYYIAQDSTNIYSSSTTGYWFRYLERNEELEGVNPKFEDTIIFNYEISDLNNEVLYSYDELGEVTYKIDKENLESGLQDGLKIMREQDEIMFLFPSYKAFGILGDKEKVGMNQSLIYKVKLIKIKSKKKE